jgi:hypothetical protein
VRIFAFDPTEHRPTFDAQGWVHIPGGITPKFLELLQEYAREQLDATRLDGFEIRGKKEQSLFEFPPFVDYPDEVFDVVSALCGLDRERITLSERHIQAYEPNADPEPHAHKDRFASQISFGLSIEVPDESRLVLFPYDHLRVNAFNSSRVLRASLQPDELPEVVARTAREVVIADRPGDVVAFHGSTTWHFRRNSANAVNLYLKLNEFGCDPLGEDPRSGEIREQSRRRLAALNGRLDGVVPALGRRFDLLSRRFTRNGDEILEASVCGEEPFGVTEMQFRLLQEADARRSAAELGASSADVRFLVERGALDLV